MEELQIEALEICVNFVSDRQTGKVSKKREATERKVQKKYSVACLKWLNDDFSSESLPSA